MVRYCPRCEKPDTDVQFHGELCLECAKVKSVQFPTVRIMVCPKCNEVLTKGHAKKGVSFADEAARLLKIKGSSPVFSPDFLSVEYETEYGRMTQPVLVLTEKCMCSECGRANSQYFEAIIQLRGDPKRVDKMAELLMRRIESRSFIPKIEELKEGLDIYCGSRNEGIAALNSQKLGFVRTEKLAGERNGKRLYRTTLLVRL